MKRTWCGTRSCSRSSRRTKPTVGPASKGGRQPGGADNGNGRRLSVSVTDGRGRSVRDGGLSQWLAFVAPAAARGEVAIALVSDAQIRKLNSQYRQKKSATDVLSFPAETGSRFLGDIVIATGTARRQAREAGHSYQAELRVLSLHGLL